MKILYLVSFSLGDDHTEYYVFHLTYFNICVGIAAVMVAGASRPASLPCAPQPGAYVELISITGRVVAYTGWRCVTVTSFKLTLTGNVLAAMVLFLFLVLHLIPLIRWFKFTLKPPYTVAIGNFFSAIWDTSHWHFFVKFGLKTAWDIS